MTAPCYDCNANCTTARCGDSVRNAARGEACDGADFGGATCVDVGFDAGDLVCDSGCAFDVTSCTDGCGNGLSEGLEECDGADLNGETCAYLGFASGPLACLPDCSFDLSGCEDGCGNGVRELAEQCDGADLGGQTCQDRGFIGGALGCHGDCTYELDQCTGGCGNGVIEGTEECDDGAANSDSTPDACRTSCLNPSCGDGVIDQGEGCDDGNADDRDACLASCQPNVCGDGIQNPSAEDCDVLDFGGQACTDLGFLGGTLSCQASCSFDLTACVGGCGNGVREGIEECDGADLAGSY